MNEIITFLRKLLFELKPWLIIQPWEEGVRTRLGHWPMLFKGGVHLKIPLIDFFFVQSVRVRISAIGRQTVTNRQGKSFTFVGSIGYALADMLKLYQTVHHPEDTIINVVRGRVAEYIASHDDCECVLSNVIETLDPVLGEDLKEFGLTQVKLYLTEWAISPTLRLFGDNVWGQYGAALTTDKSTDQ